MRTIEPFLVFTMTSLHLSVMSWGIGANQLVTDAKLRHRGFKERGDIAFTVGKPIRELEAIIRLDVLNLYPSPLKPNDHILQEVRGRVGTLLWVSTQVSYSGILIYGSVLKQPFTGIYKTAAWDDLHVDLEAFTGMRHLLVGLGCVFLFLLL